MAVYRQIQTGFWQDEFVLQLTPEEKYFYLYLLTNSKTKQCGIYQLPMQVIIMETGYNQETVEKLLNRFIDYGKIFYSPMTKELGIINWLKYNPMESPKIKACVVRELKEVKDRSLIDKIYCVSERGKNEKGYPMEGVSQEEKEEEKEKAEAEEGEKSELAGELKSTAATAGELFAKENNLHASGGSPFNQGKSGNNHLTTFVKGDLEITRKDVDEYSDIVDDYGDYKCKSIQMQGEMLLTRVWNKMHPTPEEIRLTSGYIKAFGFGEVETAFSEAVKYDKKRLAYVEIVLKKRKERRDLIDKQERERQKRLQDEKKIEEQKKSGMGLGLIKKVYGDEGGVRSRE